jgi:transposase
VSASVVRIWVERARADRGKGKPGVLTTAEREELAALRKEVRTLRMQRDLLKNAAAFFANENS